MFLDHGWYMDEQAATHKSVLPYYYMWPILVGCPTKARLWAHLRDHFRSTLTYNWIPLEEQVTNTIESQHICEWIKLVAWL